MISDKKIDKYGLTNYVIQFFKLEYKNYFLYSGILAFPFLITYIVTSTNFGNIKPPTQTTLLATSELIVPIAITILFFGIQTTFSVLYIKQIKLRKNPITLLLNTIIQSIPTSIIIGFGFVIFYCFKILNEIIPIISFLYIFIFIGAIVLGLFLLFAVLYLIDTTKSFKTFSFIIKNKTLSILNTLTALIVLFILTNYTIPTLFNLLNQVLNLTLGITISGKYTSLLISIFTLVCIYLIFHFIIVRLYMICIGISEQYKIIEEGSNINEIGETTTDEDDDLL